MKNAVAYFLLCLLLSPIAYAKNGEHPVPVANSSVQFIQNKGQITDQQGVVRKDIDAKVEANGVVMFVGDGEIHYQWVKSRESEVVSRELLSGASVPPPSAKLTPQLPHGAEQAAGDNALSEVEIYRMDVQLVGANKNAEVMFEEPTGYYENYYLAHTGEDGVTARGFQRVIYKDIYPNIDLVFYTAGMSGASVPPPSAGDIQNESSPARGDRGGYSRGIKYDFIVRPGGNPADIKLRYEGATEVKIVDGTLVAITPFGTITEAAPYSYNAETKEQVTSAYKLSGNTLSFDFGSYLGTLVIDPVVKWATYCGGIAGEGNSYVRSGAVAADYNGDAIIFLETGSTNNIATVGAHQTSHAGNGDWMIVKFNEQGVRQWGTYYGGNRFDVCIRVTVDSYNNIYCVGHTESPGLATTGAFQTSLKASTHPMMDTTNVLLVKLSSSGIRQWATYYGDTAQVSGAALVCDADNNVWIGGEISSNGPGSIAMATNGAYQSSITYSPPYYGGYFAKFSGNGNRLYGSYYPGVVRDICFDANGNYFLTGEVDTTSGIATNGAHQASPASFYDGFIAKFNSAHLRMWGTYYGGNGSLGWPAWEVIYDAVCDAFGNLYIVGTTSSLNNISTIGSFQSVYGGGNSDGFIAKFSPSGVRQWGSYYGSAGYEAIISIDIANDGLLYTTGHTESSSSVLATTGAHKTNATWGFMAIWGQDGARKYGTYYGEITSTILISILGVDCSNKDKAYFAGYTSMPTGIATNGSHQDTLSGSSDAFLVQWDMDTSVYIRQPFTDTFACTVDTLYVPYGVTQKFRSNNSFTVQLSNSSGSFASPTTLATKNSDTAGVIACYLPVSIASGTGYRVRVIATAPADTSEDNARNIRISSYPANFTAGSNSPLCSGDTLKLTSGSTTTGVTYSWSGQGSFTSADDDTIIANTTVAHSGDYYITIDNNGCMVKDTVSVVVSQTPQNVTAGNNGGLCTGDTLLLTSSSTTSGVSYAWTGPNNYNTQNVTRPNVQLSDAGTYTVTVTLGSCSDTAVTTVVVNQGASVNIAPLTPVSICTGDTAQFVAFPTNAGTNPQYQWLKNGVAVAGATGTSFKTSSLANGDIISVQLTPNTNCPGTKESNKITMTVQPILTPTVTMTADNMPPWNGGLTVTFTANPTHGGTTPEYQWKRNGQDITGATGATWGVIVNALNDNEDICVVLKSSYECAVPDTAMSNCITTAFTGIVVEATNNGFKIYPNPVSGILHIEGVETGSTIELIDVLGRKCAMAQLLNGSMDVSGLVPGVYIVKVNGVVAGRVVKE